MDHHFSHPYIWIIGFSNKITSLGCKSTTPKEYCICHYSCGNNYGSPSWSRVWIINSPPYFVPARLWMYYAVCGLLSIFATMSDHMLSMYVPPIEKLGHNVGFLPHFTILFKPRKAIQGWMLIVLWLVHCFFQHHSTLFMIMPQAFWLYK